MHEEFRPGFGRGLTVVIAVVAVISLLFIATTGNPGDALLTLPWLALVVTSCWAVFWRPCVVVSDAGVRLVNVTRTIDVPWPAVRGVRTRYALTLDTEYGSFAAWAAPAPGAGPALRTSMRSRSPRRTDAAAEQAGDRPKVTGASMGDIEGTSSGDAATIVRRRWDRLRDAGHLDDPRLEFDAPPIHWHWRIAAVLVGLAVLSLATLLVG